MAKHDAARKLKLRKKMWFVARRINLYTSFKMRNVYKISIAVVYIIC